MGWGEGGRARGEREGGELGHIGLLQGCLYRLRA